MKKIILSLCAATVALGFTACGDNDQAAGNEGSAELKAMGDSVSVAYGHMTAGEFRSRCDQMMANLSEEQKANFSKSDFMRGLESVATRDTADLAYIMGVQAGMSIWGAAQGIPNDLKIPADADKMVQAFKEVFMADSVADSYSYRMEFQEIMNKAQEIAKEQEKARLEALPESVENKAKGAAYADSLVNNAGYTRAGSGLVYKIEEQGTGDLVKANDRIKLRYVGKHINGEVFDQTREEPMTAYASRFVPGFSEGLQLLSNGGKATIVIPADLAYGVEGRDGIGHNETLVFDIEVVDIVK